MHKYLKNKKKIVHVELGKNEKHLCTVRIAGFSEAVIGFQPDYTRYYGHLTNKRLILESIQYTSKDDTILKSVKIGASIASIFCGVSNPGPSMFLKAKHTNLYNSAKEIMSTDKYVSIPYNCIKSVKIVSSMKINNFVSLSLNGVENNEKKELIYGIRPFKKSKLNWSNSSDIINNIKTHFKTNYSFPIIFVSYFKSLIKKNKKRCQ